MSHWHLNFEKNGKFSHVAAAKTTWCSDAYVHYSVSLQRNFGSKGEPHTLSYVFRCKLCPDKHPAVLQSCSKTVEGTSNLLKGMNTCLEAQGISKRSPMGMTKSNRTPVRIPESTRTPTGVQQFLKVIRFYLNLKEYK